MAELLLLTARSVWTGIPGQGALVPGAVAVQGATVVAVGHLAEVEAQCSGPYRRVGLDDVYLMPGIINAHVHLTMDAGDDPFSDYVFRDDFALLLRAVTNARTMLASGVTTVRDCGSRGYGLVLLKDPRVRAQHGLPHVLGSGPPITPTGGHLHWMGGEADGVDGVRAAVRTRAKAGVNALKLVATGGRMTPGTRPEVAAYTNAELRGAVQEARRLGIPTSAHCLSAEGIVAAVKAGIDCVDHAMFFTRDPQGRLVREFDAGTAHLLADAGTYVAPCLSAGYHRLDPVRGRVQVGSEERFRLEQEERMFEHVAKMIRLGVQVVVGTDAGVTLTPFDETFLELSLLTRVGLTAEEALLSATYHAAGALGLRGRKGTIQPGADADIIGCSADPCEVVETLAEVVWVMREGQVVADRRKQEVTQK